MGGFETLIQMEKIEVDNKDRPIEDIILQKTQVFVDPFQEAEEQLAKERADEAAKQVQEVAAAATKKRLNQPLKVYREGVGKYLDINALKGKVAAKETEVPAKKMKTAAKATFGNFSSW